jgi:hypothetical protein
MVFKIIFNSGMNLTTERTKTRMRGPDEERCGCGRLVARRVPDGIEVRCVRCKAIVFIPLTVDEHDTPLEVVHRP